MDDKGKKLFVGGLDHGTDDNSLRNFFSKWGDVVDCVVMRDDNGQSRGFGFVTFSTADSAQTAVDDKPHNIDNRNVDTKMAQPKESMNSRSNPKKVFIGGLAPETNADQLTDHFSKYGTISDSVVITSPETRESRGFGFVTFEDAASGENAVSDKPHIIGGKELEVKIAVSRDGNRRGGRGGNDRGGRGGRGRSFGGGASGGYNNYGSNGYGSYGSQGGYGQAYGVQNGGWAPSGYSGGFGDGFGSYPQQNGGSYGGPVRNYSSHRGSGPYSRY